MYGLFLRIGFMGFPSLSALRCSLLSFDGSERAICFGHSLRLAEWSHIDPSASLRGFCACFRPNCFAKHFILFPVFAASIRFCRQWPDQNHSAGCFTQLPPSFTHNLILLVVHRDIFIIARFLLYYFLDAYPLGCIAHIVGEPHFNSGSVGVDRARENEIPPRNSSFKGFPSKKTRAKFV